MAENLFNPAASAALTNLPGGEKGDKPTHPPKRKVKAQPVNTVSKAPVGFPAPNDPYWKQHPLLTEHKDGTVRAWGEDTTAIKNPNTLPKQMLPPTLDLSDKAKGYSANYYRKNN